MLLIKGLMHSVMLYPDVEYLLGPVSISNSYPRFFQSLMFYYIMEQCRTDFGRDLISPRKPFTPDYLKTDPEYLLMGKMSTLEKFDKYLMRLLTTNTVCLPLSKIYQNQFKDHLFQC